MNYKNNHMENLYSTPIPDPINRIKSDPDLNKIWMQTDIGPYYDYVSQTGKDGTGEQISIGKLEQIKSKALIETMQFLKVRNENKFNEIMEDPYFNLLGREVFDSDIGSYGHNRKARMDSTYKEIPEK